MTIDLASVVSWHNARPNAIQINISSMQVDSLSVPYWKAKTDARCHFRVQVGVYSQQAEMLALSRYQTALAEYQIKLQQWQRRKDEAERARRRDDVTSGLSGLVSALSMPHPPAQPTEEDAVEYHWSKSMSASISLDETTPACKARSVLPSASDNLFDWISVHSSPTALPGSAVIPLEVDPALIEKAEATHIGIPQATAIKSRIAAEQFDYVGNYEAQRIDFDHAPGILHCHIWRVRISCDGKKTTLLVGADGAIFGRHLKPTSMASKVALASFFALAGIGAVWVGVSKLQTPSASTSVNASATTNAPKIQPSMTMPVPRTVAAAPAPAAVARAPDVVAPMPASFVRESEPNTSTSAVTSKQAAKPMPAPAQGLVAVTTPSTLEVHVPANAGKAIGEILLSASKKDWITVFEEARAVKAAFIRPPRGDRKVARAANSAGLSLLSQDRFNEATKAFADAFAADQSDLEVLNNLGYSSILAGEYSSGSKYVLMTLSAAPERTSAWANLSEALAALDKPSEALAAMQLAVLFSANREKSVDYLTGIRDTHKSARFRSVATLALEQIDAVPIRGQVEQPATSSSLAQASKTLGAN